MGDIDPRIAKVRRYGVGVFLALAVAAVPIAIHIVRTYESPELWLTLLGAVFMLVLICLYALETALAPIPKSTHTTPLTVDPDAVTTLDEPDDDLEEQTQFHEPSLQAEPPSASDDEAAVLVEVEEVPTHPPFGAQGSLDLADQATELDPERSHLRNPDAPMLTVPNMAIPTGHDVVEDSPEDNE